MFKGTAVVMESILHDYCVRCEIICVTDEKNTNRYTLFKKERSSPDAVTAIIPCSAENNGTSARRYMLHCHRSDVSSGVFHKCGARDAKLLNRLAVHFAHLFCRNKLH
jgi:hypothetical protein